MCKQASTGLTALSLTTSRATQTQHNSDGEFNSVGRSFVVFARSDDFSQPDGNVGAVVAYGTIVAA